MNKSSKASLNHLSTEEGKRDSQKHLGTVWLVGAGCHDLSWLSQKAIEVISKAQAIVYDDLLDPAILNLAPQAKMFYRGKRGHSKSASQDEINQLLFDLSSNYSKVVRLKGGDPMVFGRGMEEIEWLQAHHVPVQVIPGISSFLGVLAKENFGPTKRGLANGFMVLSASLAHQSRTLEEWKNIAEFKGTLIFLMGMHKVQEIVASLIQAGKDPHTPAAIFTSPAMTLTKSIQAPLQNLAQEVQKKGLKSPGLIVIGPVVADFTPLKPIRIGLTSSFEFNQKVIQELPYGFQSVRVLDTLYQDLFIDLSFLKRSSRGWLVFTSIHGVACFFKLFQSQEIDLRTLYGWKIAAIGQKTALALKEHGLLADLTSVEQNSASLAQALLNQSQEEEKIILFQSQKALPILFETLKAKRRVQRFFLYDFECKPIHQEENLDLDYILFGSLTAIKAWPTDHHQNSTTYVCLSKRLAQALEKRLEKEGVFHSRVLIASHPSAQELVNIVLEDAIGKR